MHRKTPFLFVSLFASLLAIFAIVTAAAPAVRADEPSHARIVRLSFVEGDVAYQRAGSTWQRAMLNQPIQQDFSLRTDGGYAEVEFESGLVVRLAQNTQVDFTELSLIDARKVTSLKLDHGTIVTTANLGHNDEFTITSGNLNVTVPHNGRFRVDATDTENWVSVFHGKVEVASGQSTTDLESGKTLHFGGATATASVDRNPEQDAFDKWVAQRDQAEQNSQSSAGDYVSQRNYEFNVGDLYNYGLWSNLPGYGIVWQPYGLGAGWMPFGNGQWMMGDPSMGWMWTSFEPWGWLPYHYGGWVNVAGGGWFWVPQNLGTFQGATAGFVNVGNQVGWTPTIATPVNPSKVKGGVTGAPIQVVFAGSASKGVIEAGARGQLGTGSTLRTVGAPAASFAQSGPTISQLSRSGVRVTGRAPVRAVNTAVNAGGHGVVGGGASQARLSGPGSSARPMTAAPRAAAAPVMRAPSTMVMAGGNSHGGGGGARPVSGGAPAAAPAAARAGGGSAPVKH